MEKIEIVFLGTGSAVPTAKRNHIGIYLKYKDRNILVDCGEGIQRQFRKARLNFCKLTDILITHWHGDHVLGLPGLFESLYFNNYSGILNVYGPRRTKEFIKKIFEIFDHAGKIRNYIRVNEVEKDVLETPYFKISALRLDHGAFTFGYSFEEKDRLRIDKRKLSKLKIEKSEMVKLAMLAEGKNIVINGKRLRAKDYTYHEKGRKIVFIFDTKDCENAVKLAKDADLVIADSSYLKEQESLAEEYNHMTSEQAAKLAKKANAKRLILTHISQRNELREKDMLKEAKKIFKNVELAEDFMRVEL